MPVVLDTNLLAAHFRTIAWCNCCKFKNIYHLSYGTNTSYTEDTSLQEDFNVKKTFLFTNATLIISVLHVVN